MLNFLQRDPPSACEDFCSCSKCCPELDFKGKNNNTGYGCGGRGGGRGEMWYSATEL